MAEHRITNNATGSGWEYRRNNQEKTTQPVGCPIELGERSVPHDNDNTDFVGHEKEAFE